MSIDIESLGEIAIAEAEGDYLKSEQIARGLILSDPNNAEAYGCLGSSLLLQGKVEEAVTNLRTSISLDPSDSYTYGNLGTALSWQGYSEEAIANFRTALHLNPDFLRNYNDLGIALFEQGNLDEAITSYQAAISIDPDYRTAYLNLGLALHTQGNVTEAVRNYCISASLNYNEDNALEMLIPTLYVHAISSKSMGYFSQSVQTFRSIILICPNLAEAYYELGIILVYQGKLKEAITNYRTTIQLEPNHAKAQNSLREAEQQLAAKTGVTQSISDLLQQGYNAFFADDFPTAEHIARRIIDLGLNNALAYTLMGLTLSKLKRWEEAINNYRIAIRIDPDDYIYQQLGLCLALQGNLKEAITCLQTAIDLDPNKADYHVDLGSVLNLSGNVKEAVTNYRNAIRIDPNNNRAHGELRKVVQRLEVLEASSSSSKLDNISVSTSTSPSSSSCFIATAAYSTSTHPDLDTFRSFRDEKLLPHLLGKRLVSLYYKISPSLARAIDRQPTIKKLLKHQLSRLANWMRRQKSV